MFDHISGRKRRDPAKTLRAAGVSTLVHALLLAGLVWGVREGAVIYAYEPTGTGPSLAFPEGGGGGGGGAGGTEEVVAYYEIAPPPVAEPEPVELPPEEEVLPEPEPVPPPPEPERPKPPAPPTAPTVRPATSPAAPAPAGIGGGSGGGEGAGQGEGRGPGEGPGEGGGSGGGSGGGIGAGQGPGTGGGAGRIRPPSTDLLLIPPSKPKGVASQEIVVLVTVDARGRVKEAELLGSTGNRSYDAQIRRRAMEWVFNPARDVQTNRAVEFEGYRVTLLI